MHRLGRPADFLTSARQHVNCFLYSPPRDSAQTSYFGWSRYCRPPGRSAPGRCYGKAVTPKNCVHLTNPAVPLFKNGVGRAKKSKLNRPGAPSFFCKGGDQPEKAAQYWFRSRLYPPSHCWEEKGIKKGASTPVKRYTDA